LSIKKIIFRIAVIILVVETLIMLTLDNLSIEFSAIEETLIDSFMLVLFSTPIIYIWVVQPYKVEREQEQSYLFKNSRMAQMGEMISMIAHQWRQPLAAIAANAMNTKMVIELEKFDLSKEEDREEFNLYIMEHLEQINVYVQTLSTTINDFRDFYKPDKQVTVTLLQQPVEKALNIVSESFARDNIEIIEKYDSNIILEIHENEMMQVVLNIMKNAQDNFHEKEVENQKITLSTKDEKDKTVLEICDNGGGVPEEIKAKIFDPYFSTKHEKNGTGLGLYMSRTIIETHHHGKFSVHNTNDGACFVIEIFHTVLNT